MLEGVSSERSVRLNRLPHYFGRAVRRLSEVILDGYAIGSRVTAHLLNIICDKICQLLSMKNGSASPTFEVNHISIASKRLSEEGFVSGIVHDRQRPKFHFGNTFHA